MLCINGAHGVPSIYRSHQTGQTRHVGLVEQTSRDFCLVITVSTDFAVQVLPKGYGGQAEMIALQDYVKMHILSKQQVIDSLCQEAYGLSCSNNGLIATQILKKAHCMQAVQTA